MIARSQPYINVSAKRTTQLISNKNSNYNLKINLRTLPGYIGHRTSRINRSINQDAYSIHLLKNKQLQRTPILNLSVFDGHGNPDSKVSNLLADNLHNYIISNDFSKEKLFDLLLRYVQIFGGTYWNNLYQNKYKFYDKFIENCNTKIEQIIENKNSILFNRSDKNSLLTERQRLNFFYSFLKFDLDYCCGYINESKETPPDINEMIKKYPGGSTASSIFLSTFKESDMIEESFFIDSNEIFKLVVTQVGDSRILLCDSDGIAHNLVKLHHPNEFREFKRLMLAENDISTSSDAFGERRFLDNFTNTRSFGDLVGKKDGLTAEPDIFSYLIGNTIELSYNETSKLPFGGNECFIVLVTDGVSDILTDQEIVDLIASIVNVNGEKKANPQFVANEVINFISSVSNKYSDNATCLILKLTNWGKWPIIDRSGIMSEQSLLKA
ncbi:hypothetical protein KAFR_0F04280 [Kazachstania africana CBS 2517]|uniref:PPM-type phosphatase domain-containing protein n=1 Tax=Kazachstania africana (strain ATCC 22294 / BCRC 22015 / CBS 2517 / CECT 1963 / NBRC 1671 / NRRL Y-8276) TaxID=1071382 RepID=H2AXC3_KAZAF|nr:hypothetical protein KAFR_0F04280 [Kazachstania africana CBS 2517]CCF59023.1 hypothetical protein KAFR_0F04280 [Kazachstania africana CBS 2517]